MFSQILNDLTEHLFPSGDGLPQLLYPTATRSYPPYAGKKHQRTDSNFFPSVRSRPVVEHESNVPKKDVVYLLSCKSRIRPKRLKAKTAFNASGKATKFTTNIIDFSQPHPDLAGRHPSSSSSSRANSAALALGTTSLRTVSKNMSRIRLQDMQKHRTNFFVEFGFGKDPSPGEECIGVHSQKECCEKCFKKVRRPRPGEEPYENKQHDDTTELPPDDGSYTYYKYSTGLGMLYLEHTSKNHSNCCCKHGPFPSPKHRTNNSPKCFKSKGGAVSGRVGEDILDELNAAETEKKKVSRCENLHRWQVDGIIRPGTDMIQYSRILPPIMFLGIMPLFPVPWPALPFECGMYCLMNPACVGFTWMWKPEIRPVIEQFVNYKPQEILRFQPRFGECQFKGWRVFKDPPRKRDPPYNPPRTLNGHREAMMSMMYTFRENAPCTDAMPTRDENLASTSNNMLGVGGLGAAGLLLGLFGKLPIPNADAFLGNMPRKSEMPAGALKADVATGTGFCNWYRSHKNWWQYGLDRQVFKINNQTGEYESVYSPLPYDNQLTAQDNVQMQQMYCENVLDGCADADHKLHHTFLPTLASIKDIKRGAMYKNDGESANNVSWVNPTQLLIQKTVGALSKALGGMQSLIGVSKEQFGTEPDLRPPYNVQLNMTAVHRAPLCVAKPVSTAHMRKQNSPKDIPFDAWENFHPALPEVRRVQASYLPAVGNMLNKISPIPLLEQPKRTLVTDLAYLMSKEYSARAFRAWLEGRPVNQADAQKHYEGSGAMWLLNKFSFRDTEVGKVRKAFKDPSGQLGWRIPPKSLVEDQDQLRRLQKESARQHFIRQSKLA